MRKYDSGAILRRTEEATTAYFCGQKLTRNSLDELNEIRGLKVDDVALPFVTNSDRDIDSFDESLPNQSSHRCVIAERRDDGDLFQANRAIDDERRFDISLW